ncbi:MAG: hypothetical protein RSF84_09435 [Ruthenibacterium sp.]
MTIDEKKRYLLRYQDAVRQLAFCEAELVRVSTLETRITQVLSCTPAGQPDGTKPEVAAERKDSAVHLYKLAIEVHHKTMVEIMNLLNNQLRGRALTLMKLRYLSGQPWDDIAEYMGYTRDYTLQLHRDALNRIEIPETSH